MGRGCKCAWVMAVAGLSVVGTFGYTVHRSFRHGYPAGSVSSGVRPETGASTGFSTSAADRTKQTRRTVTRTTSFRMVRDPGGDFAMKAAKGANVFVELKEPEGCRWDAPPKVASSAVRLERGGAAKQRSKGVSGSPGTVLVTVRRLADENVDVVLTCRRMAAPHNDPPVRTITIRLVAP